MTTTNKIAQNPNQTPANIEELSTTERLFKMGRAFFGVFQNIGNFMSRNAIAAERSAMAIERLAQATEAQNGLLQSMGLNIHTLTYAITPNDYSRANYPIFPKSWLKGFDFSRFSIQGRSVGAKVLESDEFGATKLKYEGNVYVRRENDSKKMASALWFSRWVGKDSEGENVYFTLVKFTEKPRSDAEPST